MAVRRVRYGAGLFAGAVTVQQCIPHCSAARSSGLFIVRLLVVVVKAALPEGRMRVFVAISILFVIYFPAAMYLQLSTVRTDGDLRPLSIMSVAGDGSCASTVWLPEEITRVAIYRSGVRLGYAKNVYDDPTRLSWTTGSKRWKMIEFFSCEGGLPTQPIHALGVK
jgi:hypothetical protein